MKQSIEFWFAGGIALCCLTTTSSTLAQIVPDATLLNNSSVITDGNTSTITGGTAAGSNLFHSFEKFSVPTGSTAYFNNALNIQNIFSRVTGSEVSNIDGLLQANSANLFLLNPNGIIFGPNASLNIGGSFLGSTASSLNFADGTQFSATASQTTPLLTITAPLGLQFGDNASNISEATSAPLLPKGGRGVGIQVQGPGAVRDSNGLLLNRDVGLQVQPTKTLALVGSSLALEGGILTTDGGRIELGSVAGPSLVSLTPTAKGWSLGYEGIQNFQDIQFSQQAAVDASGVGGGDIQVRGRQVTLQDGSQIEASTLGTERGGTLNVTASDLVELIGTTADGHSSDLLTLVRPGASGDGGNLTVETGRLIVRDGARVSAETFGAGSGGTLSVTASDSVELISSGLFVTTSGTGVGGDLTIATGRLLVQGGGTGIGWYFSW